MSLINFGFNLSGGRAQKHKDNEQTLLTKDQRYDAKKRRRNYFVAKQGKPFSDFEGLCELQLKNGLDMGNNYQNVPGCKLFVQQICNNLVKENFADVCKSRYISVLADGSTDCSVSEQEIIYVRYVMDHSPFTTMCSIETLKNGSADGVYEAICNGLESVNLSLQDLKPKAQAMSDDLHQTASPKPTLVSASFDGASVNFGEKNGVVAKLKVTVPNLLGMHCVAHKLELSVLDAAKKCQSVKQFEDSLKGIYSFYHYSPKRRRELSEIANIIQEDLAPFSSVKQVRWLASRFRAVSAVEKNLTVVIQHLEHDFVAGYRAEDANKAKGYHTQLTSLNFIKYLHFLLDYLPVLSSLSQTLQRDDLVVVELPQAIEKTILKLNSLKSHHQKHMKIFFAKLDLANKKFGDIKLNPKSLPKPGNGIIPECKLTDLYDLIDDTVLYIQRRFKDLSEKPLSLFSCLDLHSWPLPKEELASYGNDELVELVQASPFSALFTDDERENVLPEWLEWKMYGVRFRTAPLLQIFKLMLDTKATSVPGGTLSTKGPMEKIIHLMMTVSPSTATCERGFSKMNHVKSVARNRLSQDMLKCQLYIMVSGPSLAVFNPVPAIQHWFEHSKGTIHSQGHKCSTTKSDEDDLFEICGK